MKYMAVSRLFVCTSPAAGLLPYPLDLRVGGQKATLAKISKNVKKYFDHQNVVRKFDLRHTLHAENYDHFQGFPHIPGLLGLKNQLKNSIFHFRFFDIFG